MSVFGNDTEEETKQDKRSKLSIDDRARLSDIESEPDEIALEILQNVDYKTLLMYCQVSRTVRRLCKTEPMRKLKVELGAQAVLKSFIKSIVLDTPKSTWIHIDFLDKHDGQEIRVFYKIERGANIKESWTCECTDMAKAIYDQYGYGGSKLLAKMIKLQSSSLARYRGESDVQFFTKPTIIERHNIVSEIFRVLSLVSVPPNIKVEVHKIHGTKHIWPREILDECLSRFKHLRLINDKFHDLHLDGSDMTFTIDVKGWSKDFSST